MSHSLNVLRTALVGLAMVGAMSDVATGGAQNVGTTHADLINFDLLAFIQS